MTNSVTKPSHLSGLIRLLAGGFGLLYVFSRFLPCHLIRPYPSGQSVDDAWTQILHVAFMERMQFGRDIVFTYGPWGFLASGYHPATHLISMVCWFVLSLVFFGAGWRVARSFTQNRLFALLWLIGFTAAASLQIGIDFANRLAAWAVLLLFLHFFVEEGAFSAYQAMLVFTLGWLGLVKFTGFIEGGFLVVIIAADNLIRYRRFPWILPVWLTGIIFFWLLAGQQAGLLGSYLKNSWAMANGYTEAMREGTLFTLEPLVFVLVGAGFAVLGIRLLRPPRRTIGVLFGLCLGGILFLSFKQGYMGDDYGHNAAAPLLLIGLACLTVVIPRRKLNVIFPAVCLVYAAIALVANAFALHDLNFGRQVIATLSFDNLLAPLSERNANRQRENYENRLSALRKTTPLPSVQGGADLYSCLQVVLFANEMSYRPRPVVQSYCAYTPNLAEMNRQWLRSGWAAPNLFFAIQPLADRFPSLDDGLSWPELLTLYDVKSLSDPAGTYLYLKRSAVPREYRLELLQDTNVMVGKPFALPAATPGPIWVQLEIKKTVAGKLLCLFYKPTALMARVELANHTEKNCSVVPGMAEAGFLVSPYIANNSSFLELAGGDDAGLAGKVVAGMTLYESGASGLAFCYQPQIKIRFYHLDFPKQDVAFHGGTLNPP